jgi:hypothetical protein
MALAIAVAAAGGGKDAHLLRKCRGGGARDFARDAWASNDFALQNRDQPGAKSRPPVCGREPPLAVPAFVGSEPRLGVKSLPLCHN